MLPPIWYVPYVSSTRSSDVGRAVRNAEAVRDELPVGDRAGRRRGIEAQAVAHVADRRVALIVRAEADVQRELDLARRAEVLLANQLRPEKPAALATRLSIGVGDCDAGLKTERETETFFDTKDAPLRVDREELEVLRVERGRARPASGESPQPFTPALYGPFPQPAVCPTKPPLRTARVEVLRVAVHQDDGNVETDLDVIEETEVDLGTGCSTPSCTPAAARCCPSWCPR